MGTTLPALLSKERREGALTHSADPARAIQTSVGDKTKTPVAWVLVCGLGHFSWPPGISQQPWNWWFLPLTFSLPMLEWQVPYSLSQHNSPCDREALMTGLGEQLLYCIASTKQALSVPSEIRYGIPLKTSPSSTHGWHLTGRHRASALKLGSQHPLPLSFHSSTGKGACRLQLGPGSSVWGTSARKLSLGKTWTPTGFSGRSTLGRPQFCFGPCKSSLSP